MDGIKVYPGKETILGIDIQYFIFTGPDAKSKHALPDPDELIKLIDRYRKSGFRNLVEKKRAQLAFAFYNSDHLPNLIPECGAILDEDAIRKMDEVASAAYGWGFTQKFGMDIGVAAKLAAVLDSKSHLTIRFSENSDDDKISDYPVFSPKSYPDEIPEAINELILRLKKNLFISRIYLIKLKTEDTPETILISSCSDDTTRIAAHWGEDPLSFHIPGIHPAHKKT